MHTPLKDFAPCSNATVCPGGNCVGCRDGRVNCRDPRCFPYCHGCKSPPHLERTSNTTFAIVALCLLSILVLLLLLYSARFYRKT